MGIRDKPIAAGSPWQNSFAERLIGTIRRECADHIVVLREAHLRRLLREYARYYNTVRTVIGPTCAGLSPGSDRTHRVACPGWPPPGAGIPSRLAKALSAHLRDTQRPYYAVTTHL